MTASNHRTTLSLRAALEVRDEEHVLWQVMLLSSSCMPPTQCWKHHLVLPRDSRNIEISRATPTEKLSFVTSRSLHSIKLTHVIPSRSRGAARPSAGARCTFAQDGPVHNKVLTRTPFDDRILRTGTQESRLKKLKTRQTTHVDMTQLYRATTRMQSKMRW